MKKIQKILLAMMVFTMGTTVLMSSCQDSESAAPADNKSTITSPELANKTDCECIINPAETVTTAEIEMLKYMREEEKLARDVYITLHEQYQLRIFNNISNSEQVHMDKILCLLDHYNIEDPALAEIGVFSNNDLQALYNSLVEQGSVSLVDALTVGAIIEDVDIFDLKEYMTQTSNEAILNIFGHLECGSENHMRAFTRMLAKNEADYTPQFINQEDYENIISGTNGPCGNGNGSGNGNGKGNGNGNGNGKGNGDCGGNGNGG